MSKKILAAARPAYMRNCEALLEEALAAGSHGNRETCIIKMKIPMQLN